jgi:hypothetical protein
MPAIVPGNRKLRASPLVGVLVAWMILVAYGASQSKVSPGKKRAAISGAIVAAIILGFVGMFLPEFALSFALLLLVAMLLAGPVNGFTVLTRLPFNLAGGSA